jgi:beta-xylosidase
MNPILHGDYPDPCILKDGEDYYLLHCTQFLLWHSQDLLHWEPLYEFPHPMGGASELCKVGDTYYVYNINPYRRDEGGLPVVQRLVVTTKDIRSGAWDGPFFVGPAFNLNNDRSWWTPDTSWISRTSAGSTCPTTCASRSLTTDCLCRTRETGLEDEVFPDDWEIQGTYTEGPRFTKRTVDLSDPRGRRYLGSATCHAIFSYRSSNAAGPWEPSPYNPLRRTFSREEKWHSKGHGMLVEAPDGSWYMPYHGYLKERYNQGRMMLMEPVEWTEDGWYRIPSWSSPDLPLPAPKGGKAVLHGYPTSVVFPHEDLPGQWIYTGKMRERMQPVADGWLVQGSGKSLHDTDGIMAYSAVYRDFQITAHMTVGNGAGGGIAMVYNPNHSVGFALKDDYTWVFNCNHHNLTRRYNGKQYLWDQIYVRLSVRDQIVRCWFSPDHETWTKLIPSFNIEHICSLAQIPRGVRGSMMFPALFAYGNGTVTFHSFEIEPL